MVAEPLLMARESLKKDVMHCGDRGSTHGSSLQHYSRGLTGLSSQSLSVLSSVDLQYNRLIWLLKCNSFMLHFNPHGN